MSNTTAQVNDFVDGDYKATYWSYQLTTGRWQAKIRISQQINEDFQDTNENRLPHDCANEAEALAAALQYVKDTIHSQRNHT